MIEKEQYKCHFCAACDGQGCINELPGMGGVRNNTNFIRNCADWDLFRTAAGADTEKRAFSLPRIRLAPITGAVENIGYHDEKPFYMDILASAVFADINLSIGDGCPDEKLRYGIEALETLHTKGAIFIKPYENRKILERMEWAANTAEYIGIDIDSYAILTMREKAKLERKTAGALTEIKQQAKVPFIIKGIFRPEDIDLVREVRPDIVVVSNHGGRVETLEGSTVSFLAKYSTQLSQFAGEIWIDGGIRKQQDLYTAKALGAEEVMLARPFITALLKSGKKGIKEYVQEQLMSGGTNST
ncbi:alpha-hydroxy-acid oxidizing protein [Brucepastera parasyntrophica]|uniref:alpha-hydroxy-acid oxidizing protein n=1 Tax=Brucepastera parasyntrophica TaxID=2880008 RepID=UPI002109D1C6|nr:alpha-hydroxy-acid oxidizing protein [Brucepastera parasyntrophica]ULQ58728.1 alpha-hydroxy-acid oxidizing protein [Brucepastera parasyntrophica]